MKPGVVALLSLALANPLLAQDQPAVLEQEMKALREDIVEAFNQRDVERLLTHVHKDVVITWQNGEVVRGHDGFRAYYKRMMEGDKAIVESATADPKVAGRAVILGGDDPTMTISFGTMGDHFKLKDGLEFDMNSHWSATLVKDADRWVVTSFHASTNVFDNAILDIAVKKTMLWSGATGLGAGLMLGLVLMWLVGRRSKALSAGSA